MCQQSKIAITKQNSEPNNDNINLHGRKVGQTEAMQATPTGVGRNIFKYSGSDLPMAAPIPGTDTGNVTAETHSIIDTNRQLGANQFKVDFWPTPDASIFPISLSRRLILSFVGSESCLGDTHKCQH